MSLKRQAKTLSVAQVRTVQVYLSAHRNPVRNNLVFLLSVRAGLRAKEIAAVRWSMVLDGEGALSPDLVLPDSAAKGTSGRVVPVSKDLWMALSDWKALNPKAQPGDNVITTARSSSTSAQAIVNMFSRWYAELGFVGCSSHSGRRTFITNAARRIGSVGGSLRDVQSLAGHSSLNTTQRYIDVNADAKRRVVELL